MSKQYTVQAPDGHTLTLEGPDNASPADVLKQAQALYRPQSSGQPAVSDILKQQAAKYPTKAEGGSPDLPTYSNALNTGLGLVNRYAVPVGRALLDTEPGTPKSTGLEPTGQPLLDIPRGVLSSGIPGGPSTEGLTLAGQVAQSPAAQIAKTGLSKITTPEALMQRATVNREAMAPLDIPLSKNPLTLARSAVNASKGARASLQESVANFMANGGPIYTPQFVAQDEASRIQSTLGEPRIPFAQSQPLNIPRPQVSNSIQDALKAGREAETPEQLFARQQQIRNLEMPSALGQSEKLNIPRPTPQPIPAAQPPESPQTIIERGIAPSGIKAKLSTLRVAPTLADIAPEIKDVPPGPLFDAGLMKAFKRTEGSVAAAENAIPDAATVPKAPIVQQFKDMSADYTARGLTASAAKMDALAEKWGALPDGIPWDTFKNMKRAFFKEGGLNAAPNRRAYGVLMDAASPLSPELAQANKEYSVVRRGLDAAGIDLQTGRRIRSVGAIPKASKPF